MRKNVLLWTMALAAMIFSACSDDDEQAPLTYSLKATPTSLTFAPTGAEAQTITVESENVTWSAMKEDMSADWLTVEFDEQQVTVKVTDNNQAAERSSRIVITPTNAESNVEDLLYPRLLIFHKRMRLVQYPTIYRRVHRPEIRVESFW